MNHLTCYGRTRALTGRYAVREPEERSERVKEKE